jgi:hypothetical protein
MPLMLFKSICIETAGNGVNLGKRTLEDIASRIAQNTNPRDIQKSLLRKWAVRT